MVVTFVLFLASSALSPCGAAAAEPGAAPKSEPAASAPEKASGAATPAAEMGGDGKQAAEEAAKADASACKKAVEALGAGDTSLNALSADKRTAVLQDQAMARVFTCLAVADGKNSYCDVLPKEGKAECVAQFEIARELKTVPKERTKSEIIYRTCLPNAAKADCEKARDAIASGDPAKCKGLAKSINPDFCAALASADAKKCDGLPQGAERNTCVAYVTDDPSRCPKDSDCSLVVSTFAKLKKEGIDGLQDIDPTLAAASKGRKACGSLLTDWERYCAKGK